MKKLMIAAATAAMVGGVFADAQVWEMTLNTKTTTAKIGTVKSACEACNGATSYRKQASLKLAGLFWGCTCDEMVGLTAPVSENEGVFFWNATKKAAFYDQAADQYAEIDFAWVLLNRIGQKATECEGVWQLNVGDFALYGAGFGKVAGCDDAAYICSMSGNFAGTFVAGNGCKRCEEASGSAWALCDCTEATELTAAYGNWTLKYNASATKKFAESSDWSWYKFPGDTLDAILQLIEGKPVPGPTPADLAKKQYAEKKQALADAEALKKDLEKAAAETIKGKELTAAKKAATEAATKAGDDLADAKKKLSAEAAALTGKADTYAAKYADTLAKQAAYDKVMANEKSTELEKKAALDNLAAAQKAEATAKKDYEENGLDVCPAVDKANYEAYTKAAFANEDAKAAKTAAENAETLWAKDTAADEKTEGTIAKARKDADEAVTKAKDALEKAAQTCIIAGVICE